MLHNCEQKMLLKVVFQKMYCISLISPPLLKDEIAFVEGEQSIDKPKSRKTFLFIITLINERFKLAVVAEWSKALSQIQV